jgi:glucan phosphoethanolaminetransferase (alkaline phosphatase superfamily)
MHEIFGVMNQWVSTRRSTRWLAIPHDSGPTVQRFRYLIGAVFIIAAAFSTYILIAQINVSMIAAVFGAEHSNTRVVWIIECIRWFLITGNIVAIAVGIMLIFFQNALHTIETHANQWYSIRKHNQKGDAMHMSFDNWVENNPGIMGWIIAIGAFIVVVNFGILLFVRS